VVRLTRLRYPMKATSKVDPVRRLKRCMGCGLELPLGWYPRNGSGERRARCRGCLRAKRSRDRAVRRERILKGAGRVTQEDVEALRRRQGYRCNVCGCDVRWEFHVDHVMALARGGRHEVGNLQILCPPCNQRKGAR
jgi:5-methylcytosine-specific restriction endonuclease McrA